MKDKMTAGLLALFLGGFGAHKFYIGKPIQGIFYVVFCWTFIPAIIALIEAIQYFSCKTEKQFNEKYVPLEVRQEAEKYKEIEETEVKKANGKTNLDEVKKANGKTNLDEVKKLKELLDMGAITQEEYDAQKKKILV